MFKTITKSFIFSFLLFSTSLFSMICDNRFFPFFPKPHTRILEKPSRFSVDPFFTMAEGAYDQNESEVAIPALFGKYDQRNLGTALDKVGLINPMPAPFMGSEYIWAIEQKIRSQGVALSFEHQAFRPVSLGFSWLLMHVNSRHLFCLESCRRLSLPGHITELEDARLQMHKNLGLCEAFSSRTGMGDFDCYIRVGDIWDYSLKFRRIDAGIRVGMILPSGKKQEINSPTTVPFGGNGHWGAYAMGDLELELKEDLKAGFFLRLGKRFQQTRKMRLPVAGEHPLFGALVAPVCVSPGINFVFSSYLCMENLREGLGARIGLNLSLQERASWQDLRPQSEQDTLPVVFSKDRTSDDESEVDFHRLADLSGWKSDYISLNVFYDFGKVAANRGYKPILTFSWDIPYLLFTSERVVKTHRVSLGIEVNF